MTRPKLALALTLGASIVALAGIVSWSRMIRMPGASFSGIPPALSAEERELRAEIVLHVQKLAGEIGERNLEHYRELVAAADYISDSFALAEFTPQRIGYEVRGKLCENIQVEIAGDQPGIFVVGAHYDSVFGSPGANDNGSGVAVLLALARRFSGKAGLKTLRFVGFPNEEPGHFQTEQMGSWIYAKRCKENGDQILGMLSLETVGYFSGTPSSQKYPLPGLGAIYPTRGNFIAFVGNVSSAALVRHAIGSFRRSATLPSEGAALPAGVPGVGWSDHWSFWQHGYPALMITDTAPFRYPHYHAQSDTPDKLDYDSIARLANGLEKAISELRNIPD